MATEEEVQNAAEDLMDVVSDIADNTSRWTKEESIEIYDSVRRQCTSSADALRMELAKEAEGG